MPQFRAQKTPHPEKNRNLSKLTEWSRDYSTNIQIGFSEQKERMQLYCAVLNLSNTFYLNNQTNQIDSLEKFDSKYGPYLIQISQITLLVECSINLMHLLALTILKQIDQTKNANLKLSLNQLSSLHLENAGADEVVTSLDNESGLLQIIFMFI